MLSITSLCVGGASPRNFRSAFYHVVQILPTLLAMDMWWPWCMTSCGRCRSIVICDLDKLRIHDFRSYPRALPDRVLQPDARALHQLHLSPRKEAKVRLGPREIGMHDLRNNLEDHSSISTTNIIKVNYGGKMWWIKLVDAS